MRNLKKLLAVVVAICVLATFTVPAFAADTTTAAATVKTDAQIATDLGVIKGSGDGVTADYLATTPDRLQGAIMFLRLLGLEDTAKAYIGTDNFSDVEGLNDTNQAILAYLKKNPDLGYEGIGDNKFDPLTKMTAKQYYKVLLIALGYTYGTDATADFTWATVFSFAASKGLVKLVDNETFTVNDLCTGTVEALKATVKGGTDTLISKLVDGGSITAAAATTSGLYSATAKALECTSATTDNLRTVKFVFNKELDEDTVTLDNFATDDDIFSAVKLLDDNKTVLGIISDDEQDNIDQSDSYDVDISDVKATDGTTISDVTKTVTFVDTTIPAVTGVTVKNPKTIVISTSEPMNYINKYNKTLSDITVDGSTKIGTSTYDYEKNTLTVIFASAMSVGTRKIAISGMQDYAGYTAIATSYNVDVVADTTPPSMVSAEMITVNELDVTFSEELDDIGSFEVDGVDAKSAVQNTDDHSIVRLTLAKDLGIGATVEIKITYVDQTDVMGNDVESDTNFTFKVSDDTTLPTVKASIDSDSNDITLTFSKSMYTTAGTIKILNADDSDKQLHKFTVSKNMFTDGSDFTEIVLDEGDSDLNNRDAISVKVLIEDMTDGTVRKNTLPDTTLTLETNDASAPSINQYYTADSDDETVTFYFGEDMDKDTLKNLSNYRIYNGTTKIGTKNYSGETLSYIGADVDSVDSDSITINIDGSYAALTDGHTYFEVSAVEDEDGNMADGVKTVTWQGDADPLDFISTTGSIKATAQDTIEVTFNQDIGSIDPDLFYVKNTAGELVTTFTEVSVDDDVATFTTADDIGTTTESLRLYLNELSACEDVFGNGLDDLKAKTGRDEGDLFKIADKIAPEVDEIDDSDGTSTGAIYIDFTEIVNVPTTTDYVSVIKALASDMIVRDEDGNTINLSTGTNDAGKSYKVDFYRGSTYVGDLAAMSYGKAFDTIIIQNLNEGEDYTVQFIGSTIYDGDSNLLAAEEKTEVTTEQN